MRTSIWHKINSAPPPDPRKRRIPGPYAKLLKFIDQTLGVTVQQRHAETGDIGLESGIKLMLMRYGALQVEVERLRLLSAHSSGTSELKS